MSEIIEYHRQQFTAALHGLQPCNTDSVLKRVVDEFAQDVARYGPILKHRSFVEEKEWRLVSSPLPTEHPKVGYRDGPKTVIPYYKFDLTNENNPSLAVVGDRNNSLEVRVGPTPDIPAAEYAVESLMLNRIGPGCWHGSSDTPYRGW